MITDIRFGHAKHSSWITDETAFYVYHNLSGTVLINSRPPEEWVGITVDIEAILSHETLHKVIFRLEGGKVSSSLDKWCKSRDWLFNDACGVCFFADEF